ncbi:mitochondrial import receptor subunit TOM70 [Coccinella septempunctata]|uniref:mitochondrial import receptor subunit TOM70 n=1 Tax=Coccinella septempunctata TaxID=41139 RepID=UPI001D09801C|nr:mitochondrial import receptor subunit TOM70 [Coccinella septempunctata]
MDSSGGSGNSPFPKWQIAMSVGAAGAIGLVGYWYLKSNRSPLFHRFRGTSEESVDEPSVSKSKAVETPFEKAQNYKAEGNSAFKNGKYDEAIRYYTQAIEICPADKINDIATFYQNRAAAYEQLKKWSAVIDDCSKAIELNPKYEKALFRRAKIRETIKDYENCLDDITCVCLLQGFQNQNALLMADRVLKQLGKIHAQEAMKSRKPIIPSKIYIQNYFASFSDDPVAKILLEVGEPLGQGELKGFLKAKLAFATGKYEEIIPACTEEINSSESDINYIVESLYLRATFYFLCGQFKEALLDLNNIIENEEYDYKIRVNALIKRASIYMQTEELQACQKDYETAIEIGPNIADVYHHRGQFKLLTEKIDEAREDFQKAVTLNPNFPIAYIQKLYGDYRYALQIQDMGLLFENMENFKKAIKKFPDCTECYLLFGQVLAEKQSFEEADDLYKQAQNVNPANPTILVHRGLLLLQWKNDIEGSVKLMREAIELDNKCEFAYETLGTIEVQRGNLLLAIELFNKAIELVRSEMEVVHLFSLRDAAASQLKVINQMGIKPQFGGI